MQNLHRCLRGSLTNLAKVWMGAFGCCCCLFCWLVSWWWWWWWFSFYFVLYFGLLSWRFLSKKMASINKRDQTTWGKKGWTYTAVPTDIAYLSRRKLCYQPVYCTRARTHTHTNALYLAWFSCGILKQNKTITNKQQNHFHQRQFLLRVLAQITCEYLSKTVCLNYYRSNLWSQFRMFNIRFHGIAAWCVSRSYPIHLAFCHGSYPIYLAFCHGWLSMQFVL